MRSRPFIRPFCSLILPIFKTFIITLVLNHIVNYCKPIPNFPFSNTILIILPSLFGCRATCEVGCWATCEEKETETAGEGKICAQSGLKLIPGGVSEKIILRGPGPRHHTPLIVNIANNTHRSSIRLRFNSSSHISNSIALEGP